MLDIYLASYIHGLQYFLISMQSRHQQPKVKNMKSIGMASLQQQGSVSENESQFDLPLRTVRRIFGADGILFIQKNTPRNRNCRWTIPENLLYKEFLKNNMHLFESKFFDRKNSRINVMMSDQIKIKTPNQCRSHHQKMMKKHQNVAEIIKFIEDIQNLPSPLEIKQRTQEGGLRRLTKDGIVQQMDERLGQEGLDMIQTLKSAQLPCQIGSLPQQDISLRQIEENLFNCSHQLISEYLQPNVWWDGLEF